MCCGRYLKNKPFQNSSQDIHQLKTNITILITEVTRAAIKKVARNLFKRANSCVNTNDGGLFEHLKLVSTYGILYLCFIQNSKPL